MSTLQGKTAVITGGGTGIGLACARRLAADGARVVLMARALDRLETAAAGIEDARAIAVDVTDDESVQAAFDAAGPVDILVNNAGIAGAKAFRKLSMEDWHRYQAVNVDGVVRCSQAVLGHMEGADYARIVNMASIAGLGGGAYIAPYSASKHAVIGLTRSLALEYARTNLTVNAVCPGYVETEIVESAVANIMEKTGRTREQATAELTKHNPQGRLIQPDEVAEAVAWLCSPLSRSVSGQAITINGGDA